MVHDYPELRSKIFDFLQNDLFKPDYHMEFYQFRELTMQRVKALASQKFFSIRDYLQNPRRFIAVMESYAFCDYSMAIKSGVHFTLFGGTVAKLGTKKHHDKYFQGIDDLSMPGCFGMTELGHGSNVMGIETTAVFDPRTREFVINTPSNEASKYWIGGAGQHCRHCAVFAQLTINGKWEGPHVFIVRIRSDDGATMPNVRLKDLGAKLGLNGVDNGQIWFDNVRVPYDAMLDAYASVDSEGCYRSKISSVAQRFGTMVGGLTTGRICIASAAVDACKQALIIAISYSVARPQFGERVIMEYVTQQRRLLPYLASTVALHLALGQLKEVNDRAAEGDAAAAKQVHVLSSGLKAAATWTRVVVTQHARECCGGMGFLSANKLGALKTDMDVDVTFEGDNTVLMQQVAKALLDAAATARSPPPAPPMMVLGGDTSAAQLLQLLSYREAELTHRLAAAMAAAGSTAAAAAVFDARLDEVVALGWAAMERHCMATMIGKTDAAPSPRLRGILCLLTRLYGLSSVEASLAFYLDAGALQRGASAQLRQQLDGVFKVLTANNSLLALQICRGFGVPDHLITAPIAHNWRVVGA